MSATTAPPRLRVPVPPGLAALCRAHHVRRLDVFGSAVTDRFDPGRSDVDVLVEFESDSATDAFANYFGLLDGLERLFGRQVDVVMQRAIQNPYLRQRAIAERVQVFPVP